jgi:hypothetical protein
LASSNISVFCNSPDSQYQLVMTKKFLSCFKFHELETCVSIYLHLTHTCSIINNTGCVATLNRYIMLWCESPVAGISHYHQAFHHNDRISKRLYFCFFNCWTNKIYQIPKIFTFILKEIIETHSLFTTQSNIINLQIDQ